MFSVMLSLLYIDFLLSTTLPPFLLFPSPLLLSSLRDKRLLDEEEKEDRDPLEQSVRGFVSISGFRELMENVKKEEEERINEEGDEEEKDEVEGKEQIVHVFLDDEISENDEKSEKEEKSEREEKSEKEECEKKSKSENEVSIAVAKIDVSTLVDEGEELDLKGENERRE